MYIEENVMYLCQSIYSAKQFLKEVEKLGYCWRSGYRPTERTYFRDNILYMYYYICTENKRKVLMCRNSPYEVIEYVVKEYEPSLIKRYLKERYEIR